MAAVELIMPKMGESIVEATILKWLKNVGDTVEADESILEIATDKVDSEVPSPVSGTLTETLYSEGDTIEVGKAIAVINTEGGEAQTSPSAEVSVPTQQTNEPAAETSPPEPAPTPAPAAVPAPAPVPVLESSTPSQSNGNGRFYSPLVLNIARREGIDMGLLESIPGSGKNNRLTKKDILNYVANRGETPTTPTAEPAATPAVAAATPAESTPAPTPQAAGSDEEIIEMDRMRKLIADHMVMSVQTAPHVTSFVEADVTNMVHWRNKAKDKFLEREGEKLTFTPLFMECVIKALKDFPMVNSSIREGQIVIKKYINIGMATALPGGNLIVPVIKAADQKNLVGLTKNVNDLAKRARDNQLRPDDIDGGTFTLTNVGTFGNLMGTPIIFQPQSAILATGVIKKKAVVIETPEGDMIGIRHMMFLSHSYDHRVIDGALGGAFVRKVADYMEQFDVNREI